MLVVIGVPLAWHKVRGGIEAEWIGYWLDLDRFEVGVSEAAGVVVGRGRLVARAVDMGTLKAIHELIEHLHKIYTYI